jgi:hypothetical protein
MRWAGVLVIAAFAVVFAGQGSAAPDPTAEADAILAHAKAASGGGAWDRLQGWHERGVIVRRDGQVDYEAWIDMRDLAIVNTRTADGATVVHGSDGRASWIIDPAGGVRFDTTSNGLAASRRNAYFSIFGYFFPKRFAAQRVYVGPQVSGGVTYDVVRVTPADGSPMELWIDRATHRIGALVDPDKAHPMIALLSDYRPVGGVMVPFTVATSFGGPRAAIVQHIGAYDFGPPDPSRFTPPQP